MDSLTRKALGEARSCRVPGLSEAFRRQRAKSQAMDMLAGLSESTGHPLQMGETIQQQVLVKTQEDS